MANPATTTATSSPSFPTVTITPTTASGGVASLQGLIASSVQAAMAPVSQLLRTLDGTMKGMQSASAGPSGVSGGGPLTRTPPTGGWLGEVKE